MKQTQRLLMIFFITSIILPLAIVVLFETDIIALGSSRLRVKWRFVSVDTKAR